MIGKILRSLSIVAGVAFIGAAVFQWITFEYPDANPIMPGAIFKPGVAAQIFNWLIVCVIATIGVGLIRLGKTRGDSNSDQTHDH